MRLLAAALVVFALSASPASGSWTLPVNDEQALGAYLPIARAAWPDSPCRGRETVLLHADQALTSDHGGTNTFGDAFPSECVVRMVNGLQPITFCNVLVHEFGHLAGLDHSTDPTNIMYFGPAPDWAACLAATASAPRQMEEGLEWWYPGGRVACSWTRCVMIRGRQVTVWAVRAPRDGAWKIGRVLRRYRV